MKSYQEILEGLQKILNDNPFDDRYTIIKDTIELLRLQKAQIEIDKMMIRSNDMT